MSKPCTCLKCVESLLNPVPCQCEQCVIAFQHNVCPVAYGYNSAMRLIQSTYMELDPIFKVLEDRVQWSQDRMKPP